MFSSLSLEDEYCEIENQVSGIFVSIMPIVWPNDLFLLLVSTFPDTINLSTLYIYIFFFSTERLCIYLISNRKVKKKIQSVFHPSFVVGIVNCSQSVVIYHTLNSYNDMYILTCVRVYASFSEGHRILSVRWMLPF